MMFTRESIHTELIELLADAQAHGDPHQFNMRLEPLIVTLSGVPQFPKRRRDKGPRQFVPVPDADIFLAVLRQIELARRYVASPPPLWEKAEECIQQALAKFDAHGD